LQQTTNISSTFSEYCTEYCGFGFNGKENDNEVKGTGNSLDFGARIYDSRTGRWLACDPKSNEYPAFTPYGFALNMPIGAVDPNGEVVVFINGNHFGDGGKAEYWREYAYETRLVERSCIGEYVKSKVETFAFDKEVMKQFNDYKAIYRDGAMGGWAPLNGENMSAENRRIAGNVQATNDAKALLSNLDAGETIKIVSHSMGAAYAKGYAEGLTVYMEENNIKNVKIEIEVDFAPYQPDNEANSAYGSRNPDEADRGKVPTYQASHSKDKVAGDKKMNGAKKVDTSGDKSQGHSITGFKNTVKKLGKILQDERKK
jgi:RHS repeat-associated protein